MRARLWAAIAILGVAVSGAAQSVEGVDLLAGYAFLQTPAESAAGLTAVNSNGWMASLKVRLRPWIGLVVEANGNYGARKMVPVQFQPRETEFGTLRQTVVAFGPEIRVWDGHRVAVHARALAGGVRMGELVLPLREPFQPEGQSTVIREFRLGPATPVAGVLGGSVDYRLSKYISWRVLQADLVATRLGGTDTAYNLRLASGLVLTLGWR